MLETRLAGEAVALHSSGALFLPAQRTVLVADPHFGKAVSFRRLGVPVPRGTTLENLDALDALLAAHAARRIVFLGDLLHARAAHARQTMAAVEAWREQRPALELVLVRGNHDDRAGDPAPALGVHCVDEPFALAAAPGLALCHHPEPQPGFAYTLGGHLHPCTTVGRGIDRLRLPCFHFGVAVGVLPAFGAFTGAHPIERAPGDRVYVVADNAVHALP